MWQVSPPMERTLGVLHKSGMSRKPALQLVPFTCVVRPSVHLCCCASRNACHDLQAAALGAVLLEAALEAVALKAVLLEAAMEAAPEAALLQVLLHVLLDAL